MGSKRRYAREAQAIYGHLQQATLIFLKATSGDESANQVADGLQEFVQSMDETELQAFTSHLERLASCLEGKEVSI
jgi:hypothetical protein